MGSPPSVGAVVSVVGASVVAEGAAVDDVVPAVPPEQAETTAISATSAVNLTNRTPSRLLGEKVSVESVFVFICEWMCAGCALEMCALPTLAASGTEPPLPIWQERASFSVSPHSPSLPVGGCHRRCRRRLSGV